MGECGIPKLMAAELYKPFIIRKLIERGIVKTVKSALKPRYGISSRMLLKSIPYC